MAKMIIIDMKRDKGGDIMKQMIGDGAFPDRLSQALQGIMGDMYPMDEKPCMREMWPGQGFPVSDLMHAILNYMYATAQRPHIPPEVMNNMRTEVSNVMEASGGFDEDLQKEVISGSRKVYNRVLSDGTEIKIEISKPVAKQSSGIDSVIEDIKNRKTASAEASYKTLKVDLDKLAIRLNKVAQFFPDKNIIADLDEVVRKAAANCVIPVIGNEYWLSGMISKIAEASGDSSDKVVSDVVADKSSGNKLVVYGQLVDKSKFCEYPFNDRGSAVKAIGSQATDLICNNNGNIEAAKLKSLEEYAEEDPVIGRVLDRLVPYIGWKDSE